MYSSKRVALLSFAVIVSLLLASIGVFAQENEDGLFSDVPQDHWAYEDVNFLAQRGIITGLPGGEYQGEEAITRYQVAALVARAVKYVKNHPQSISDKDISTLEDLVFKLSDRVESMNKDYKNVQSRVNQLQTEVNDIKQSGVGTSPQISELQQRAKNNFYLGIAGVVVGVAALAYSFLSA